jgi:predicted DNA binding CopG/RHH family protein
MAKRKKTDVQLDPYEMDLENNFEKAEKLSAETKEQHQQVLEKAASNYMIKDKRISIRVYGEDLERIKQIAYKEGLPYQTLITSILHKYATGQLH